MNKWSAVHKKTCPFFFFIERNDEKEKEKKKSMTLDTSAISLEITTNFTCLSHLENRL